MRWAAILAIIGLVFLIWVMAGGDYNHLRGCFPDGSAGKEPICNAKDTGDTGSIPRSRGAPKGGNGNSLQYSCLKNPMDRGAWWATVHGVARVGHD